MPRFTKEGFQPIETAIASEAAELRSQGWSEQKARTAEVKKAEAAQAPESTK